MNGATSNLSFGGLVRNPQATQPNGTQTDKPPSVSLHQEPDCIHFSSGEFKKNENGNLVWKDDVPVLDSPASRAIAERKAEERKARLAEQAKTSGENDQSKK
jgi:hypothetical protein